MAPDLSGLTDEQLDHFAELVAAHVIRMARTEVQTAIAASHDSARPLGDAWAHFFAAWWDRFADMPVTVAKLMPVALTIPGLLPDPPPGARGFRSALGQALSRRRNQAHGPWTLYFRGLSHNAATYCLQRWEDTP